MPGVSSRLGLRENLEETIDFPMKYGGGSCKCSLKPIQWVFEGTMIRILLPSIMATCWIVFMIAENHNLEIWTITCFRPHDICTYHLCISIFYIWSSLDPHSPPWKIQLAVNPKWNMYLICIFTSYVPTPYGRTACIQNVICHFHAPLWFPDANELYDLYDYTFKHINVTIVWLAGFKHVWCSTQKMWSELIQID